MENRTYTVALAMVFALIAIVTCLIVLVILMMVMRPESPMLALPAPSFPPTPTLAPTVQINLALEPSLVLPTGPAAVPTAAPLVAPTLAAPMPTQPVFLAIPSQLPTAHVAATTPRPSPRPVRLVATSTPKGPPPTPTSNFQFLPDGGVKPDTTRACTGGAIFGYFRDVDGKPLAGARVKVYNQYLTEQNISAPSKPMGASDAGFYDFVVNPRPGEWNVVVVDPGGTPISPEVQVIRPAGVEVCYFQVDWKATR
jgi:hypothetical protein